MRASHLRLIATREFKERTRSRTFKITMALMVLAVIASVMLPTLISRFQQDPKTTVAVLDQGNATLIPALKSVTPALGAEIEIRSFSDRQQAEQSLRDREINLLVIENEAVLLAVQPTPGVPSAELALAETLAVVVSQIDVLSSVGVNQQEIVDTITSPSIVVKGLDPAPQRNSQDAAGAYPALILLFVFLTLGGAFILNGVIEEKTSRVVEILLATVRPSELLVGKVIGIGIVGLMQGVVLVAATFAARALTPGALSEGSLSVPVIAYAILWFVLGFALYSGMYACAGALVSRSEDAQNLVFPMQIPLLSSFVVGAAASIGGTNKVLEVMSFIPFTAPMTMLERMAAQEVQWWEILISISLTVITAIIILRLAVVIFAGGILRSGQRVKLREAWQNPAG